ncbi:MAG: AI-2E family transporter [Ruminococcaceae bacterium]|nr:AI-2E family transporter [Oscillospiraceae bacterium]
MKLDWKTCLRVGVSLFVLYLAIHYWPSVSGFLSLILSAALPLMIGAAIAYCINIPMDHYEALFRRVLKGERGQKLVRPVSLVLALVSVVAIVVLVVWLVLPQLVECVRLIAAEVPGFIQRLLVLADEYHVLSEDVIETLSNIDWQSRMGEIVKAVTSGVGSMMDVVVTAVTGVFSGIVTGFLALIFALYLLAGKERLSGQLKAISRRYLPQRWYDGGVYVLGIFNTCFRRYIVGQCTEAVILGSLCALGMLLLQLPYATMIGALVAFTALIPVAGAYIGAVVGAFMILTVSPMKALIFLIFLVVLQQLEGNLIYPRVVGSSLGLPGIWVLAAVTVGGGVMGIVGMLLGVPMAAAIYRLLRNDVRRGQENPS